MVDIDDKDSSEVDTILEEYSMDVVGAMEVVWIDEVAVVVVVVVDVVIKPLRVGDVKFTLIKIISTVHI